MDNDTTGIIVVAIPGMVAILLALFAMWERRQDKRSERIKKEKEAELETIKEHSAAAIKIIADDISKKWQARVLELEAQVKELQRQVENLKQELSTAYDELKRLKAARSGTKPPMK